LQQLGGMVVHQMIQMLQIHGMIEVAFFMDQIGQIFLIFRVLIIQEQVQPIIHGEWLF